MSTLLEESQGLLTKYPHEFGIELEMEFTKPWSPGQMYNSGSGWVVDSDGSLRKNGREFISKGSGPTRSFVDLDNHLFELFRLLNCCELGGKPLPTSRCGMHLHLNMQNKTLDQIYNFICNWYAVETYLIPENRKGSLFCISGLEDGSPFDTLINSIMQNNSTAYIKLFCGTLSSDNIKYSAMNVAPLKFLGSLEFRFMNSTTDMEEIHHWVMLIHKLFNKLSSIDPNEFLDSCLFGGSLNTLLNEVIDDNLLTHFDKVVDVENLFQVEDSHYIRHLIFTKEKFKESFFEKSEPINIAKKGRKYFFGSEQDSDLAV